jgi:sugar phosphate isomerase/epimerase
MLLLRLCKMMERSFFAGGQMLMLTLPNGIHVGVQSYCFREFANEQIIGMLKECGLDTIELFRKHAGLDERREDEVIRLYRDHGIAISSFGINPYPNNEAVIRPYFEFAKKAGIRYLGASPSPDSFELLERLCEEYKIGIAIHNHGRKDKTYGTVEQLEQALAQTSDRIGLCLDTAWLLDVSADPVETLRKFAGRVYGVHLKDYTFDSDGNRHEQIIGRGGLRLREFLHLLLETGFAGYVSIEYEADAQNPLDGIRQCIEAVKKATE